MPRPTPFHARTHALCTSMLYKEWAGCYAVRRYDVYHEREYYALRHQATVMDATPLFKVEVRGRDAAEFLSYVSVRGFTKTSVGRVGYVCWVNERGQVFDDGTVARLGDEHFRLTSAEPAMHWLQRHARGFDVSFEDTSRTLGALALQGPLARDVLRGLVGSGVDALGFFRAMDARVQAGGSGGFDVGVTRTGYTGDLGYELWVDQAHALELWDALMEAGAPLGLLPMGLDALDVSRIEAGFVLQGVDYFSARRTQVEEQTSTPYELGLDWMVKLERAPFIGQEALRREKLRGSKWALVGLDIDWEDFEALHAEFGLPPHLSADASREGVPLYLDAAQVGQATSRAWSPTLKKYLAIASVHAPHATLGKELSIEVTVEYERRRAKATVVKLPFYDPERKKA